MAFFYVRSTERDGLLQWPGYESLDESCHLDLYKQKERMSRAKLAFEVALLVKAHIEVNNTFF